MAELLGGVFKWAVLGSIVAVVLTLTVWSPGPNAEPTRQAARAEPTAAPTATPEPTKTPTELKREAEYLDPRRLAADPEGHVGQNVYLQGEALNVGQEDNYTWVQLLGQVRDRSVTESIVVVLTPPDLDVLKAECYRFFGLVSGTTETTLVLTGAKNDQPQVDAYTYEPSERGESYGCEAL